MINVGDTAVSKIVRTPVLAEFASKWETQMLDELRVYLLNNKCDTKEMGLTCI